MAVITALPVGLEAQTQPAAHLTAKRVIAATVGVVAGGLTGYLVGRHLASPSLCEGCSTSVNHDGYLGAGLAIGAVAGGVVGWYVAAPRHAGSVRVLPASSLTNVAADKRSTDWRGLRPRFLFDSLAAELGR